MFSRFSRHLFNYHQRRGAKVFRRIFEPNLPANATPEQIEKSVYTEDYKFLRYEIVEENDVEPENIKVIILRSSEEFGKRGQIRTLNARVARQELLLPGFGVYASPENLQRYTDIVIPEDAVQYSSTSVSESIAELSKTVVPVVMNGEESWTLQPWHLKLALLNQGIFVNEDCIQIAEEIKGPNPAYEAKEFLITLSINNFEKANIRGILFHQDTVDTSEIPHSGWDKRFYQPIFASQADTLKMLPRHKLNAEDVVHLADGREIIETYAKWKNERDTKLFSKDVGKSEI